MSNWYYVENNDRVGPIEEEKLVALMKDKKLQAESYVWKKGFDNWKKIKEVEELKTHLGGDLEEELEIPAPIEDQKQPGIDWDQLSPTERIISIKVGLDRGTENVEYGPFSLDMLKRLYNEKRINGKTLIFAPGMDNWIFFADLPIFEKLVAEVPPVIEESERRADIRRPFVARLLFHDNSVLYEGICRDISVGGLQVLVANAPVKVGTVITMNVHPENSEHGFVAKGKVVRLLEGNQGFSLRFVELNEDAQNAINSYVEGNE